MVTGIYAICQTTFLLPIQTDRIVLTIQNQRNHFFESKSNRSKNQSFLNQNRLYSIYQTNL
jgi:hypothetical protein